MMYRPASSPRSFPAPAGEVSAQCRRSAYGGSEGASCPSPRSALGGRGRWSAAGGSEGSSPLLPRLSKIRRRRNGGGAERSEAEGVFLSPSGCHGLLRRTTRAPSSPSAPEHTNDQRIQEPGCHHSPQSGAVVLLQPPKHTTERPRREWSHPDTPTPLLSPRGVAGETSPAQACNLTLIRKWGR